MGFETPSRGRASIEESSEQLQILIPAARTWSATLCVVVSTIMMVFIFVVDTRAPDLFKFLVISYGLFSLWIVLWCIRGRELITIDSTAVTIERQCIIQLSARQYVPAEVKNLRMRERSNAETYFPQWFEMIGLTGGEIWI